MDNYMMDMHVHTSETSACGEVAGADAARCYKDAGYQGIMITDHYHKPFFDGLGPMDMDRKIEAYLTGYRAARQEGEKIGLDVLLGIEFRNFEADEDFLIVGITEEFLHHYPETYNLPMKQAIDLFHENGMLVIQAHPVRFRMVDNIGGQLFMGYKNYEMLEMLERKPWIREVFSEEWKETDGIDGAAEYPFMLRVCRLRCEEDLDGIEVYNGNDHWSQQPRLIREIVNRHPDYIQISSSDFHEPGHLGRGGILLERRVRNSLELKEELINRGIKERIRR